MQIKGTRRMTRTKQAGDTKLIVLILVAVLLAAGYGGLDMYGEGEKYATMTESRGMQIIQGLSKHRLAAGAYPDTIDKLAPKFIAAVPRCPAGEPFAYALSASERGGGKVSRRPLILCRQTRLKFVSGGRLR